MCQFGVYVSIPKEIAREIGRFHKVDPTELTDFNEHAEWLNALLSGPCYVDEYDGKLCLIEIKHIVDKVNGLKIEVYSNEHPPPHFHVKTPNINASFVIENCELLNGEIGRKDLKIIQYWHQKSKQILIKAWNSTRPTNCVVGAYQST